MGAGNRGKYKMQEMISKSPGMLAQSRPRQQWRAAQKALSGAQEWEEGLKKGQGERLRVENT